MSLQNLITDNSSSTTTTSEKTSGGFLNYSKYEEQEDVSALSFDNERILVLDAGAFINYMKIEKHGSKFITTPQVLNEIKDSRSRHILLTLPFDIHVREPTEDDIKTVSRYAKKTGDYANLSATDIGIIALTLTIEKEMNGTKNLKPEPKSLNIAAGIKCSTPLAYSELRNKMEDKPVGSQRSDVTAEEEEADTEEKVVEEEEDDEDDGEWITPENIKEYKERTNNLNKDTSWSVGCVTSDFSVQHVLAHMGLNLVSVDGFRIKYLSQWVKRCTCCYTIVPDVERRFCPNCGHETLKRITCVMDEDGTLNFYYNPKAKISLRGTIYTNPIPKGGKYHKDPIYREDQLKGFGVSKKNNKLLNKKQDDDYDLYSKNAFNKRKNPPRRR
ncbi:predicted protein [Naegleria gruberi]|uniref:Predicted protein n=1 Tax=Naegleria gruberi TaxID=5762 RepID=D2V5W8_NAEGR|nr:uncharacterized protein NAEGRDRAFT_31334 [Naegleria gruberi]EFC47870.1 predicted protein [Naegleria gruberi]|eukprot:XP_002680614.1 predicted protein [Naegleria gruberi strain NEG-M]